MQQAVVDSGDMPDLCLLWLHRKTERAAQTMQ
jgi:hypothetical protein